MTATFTLEMLPVGTFHLSGGCAWDEDLPAIVDENGEALSFTSWDDTMTALVAHKAVCGECETWGCHGVADVDVSDEFDVTLSNASAHTVLNALGFDTKEFGLAGMVDADDFMGRVLIAMAEDRDDSGVKSAVTNGREIGLPGATIIDCGLAPGQFAEWFEALHALAAEAQRIGRSVQWA